MRLGRIKVLNASDHVFKREKFNGEIMFHWKRTNDCIFTSERLDKNYCEIQSWRNFAHICIVHQTYFWEEQDLAQKQLCSNERNKLKVYIYLKDNKLTCFANS